MLLYKRILFALARLTTKLDENKVVFESFQGRSYSCNPKGIYEAMLNAKEFDNFKFVWVFRNQSKKDLLPDVSRTKVVGFEGFSYYRELASAKYWVFNSNTRSFLKPSAKQIFTQTWHGTPLKRIGCDVEKQGNVVTNISDNIKLYNREAKKISFMVSPSDYCTDKLISAFDLKKYGKENVVLNTGYPRNDSLFTFDEKRVYELKNKYGIPTDKKVVMYAPTFRDNKLGSTKGFGIEESLDFNELRNKLGDDFVIIFRAHYFISERLNLNSFKGFVFDLSNVDDVNELYIMSDMLITDYSSVFFDYANLKRPILFYMYDYEEYKNQIRDFYEDAKELPGPMVTNQDELIAAIKTLINEFSVDENFKKFNDKYNYLDGKDCGLKAARIITGKEALEEK